MCREFTGLEELPLSSVAAVWRTELQEGYKTPGPAENTSMLGGVANTLCPVDVQVMDLRTCHSYLLS
jgi:hypothetical protein